MKTCKDCQTPKHISSFPKNGNSFRSRCKICHSDYKKGLKTAQKAKDREILVYKLNVALWGGER
jgi:hypothetical protein